MSSSAEEMMRLLARSARSKSVVVSSSSDGSVSMELGCTYQNGGRVEFSDIRINDRGYSFDDPAAVNTMQERERETFWTFCSDKGKDSDLYRAYAHTYLKKAQISLDNIKSSHLRLLIINHAVSFAKLIEYCVQQGYSTCFNELQSFPERQFKNIITQSNGVQQLIESLKTLRYKEPLSLLKSIEPDYLSMLLNNAYNTAQFLKGLNHLGHKDPLSIVLSIEITQLESILKNYYNILQVMDGFSKLGYTDPWTKFLSLTPNQSSLLLSQHYNCFETMKNLAKLGYIDPFAVFLSIDPNKLQQLLKNHYSAFELIEFFASIQDKKPLQTYLNLKDATCVLFLKNTYGATQIMSALHRCKKEPVSYLEQFDQVALVTMLNSCNEYVSRILRGVDLTLEFKPVSTNNNYSPALTKFIESNRASNSVELTAADIDPSILGQVQDVATKQITKTPVRLDGDLFDLNHLLGLPQDREGYRTNPLSGEKFLLSQLQPAKDIQQKLLDLGKEKAAAAEAPTTRNF